MTIEKAQTIVEEFEEKLKPQTYTTKSNSVKAAALTICIPAEELCERLNAKHPKEIKQDMLKLVSLANAMYERAVSDGTGLWLSKEFQEWNLRNKTK